MKLSNKRTMMFVNSIMGFHSKKEWCLKALYYEQALNEALNDKGELLDQVTQLKEKVEGLTKYLEDLKKKYCPFCETKTETDTTGLRFCPNEICGWDEEI